MREDRVDEKAGILLEPRKLPFGWGIQTQGEIVRDYEQYRLLMKRNWLQLFEFFGRNHEWIKAFEIPVPWTLEHDFEINECLRLARDHLARFKSEKALREYIDSGEPPYHTKEQMSEWSKRRKNNPRNKWIDETLDALISTLPQLSGPGMSRAQVLEVGAGIGEVSLNLTRRGMLVDSISPCRHFREHLQAIAIEEGLPLTLIDCIFETWDPPRRYPIIFLGEVLEHVENDILFLRKAAEVATQYIVITTPEGCGTHGFRYYADWKRDSHHVRAYSDTRLTFVLNQVDGWSVEKMDRIPCLQNEIGEWFRSYCVVLKNDERETGTHSNPEENLIRG